MQAMKLRWNFQMARKKEGENSYKRCYHNTIFSFYYSEFPIPPIGNVLCSFTTCNSPAGPSHNEKKTLRFTIRIENENAPPMKRKNKGYGVASFNPNTHSRTQLRMIVWWWWRKRKKFHPRMKRWNGEKCLVELISPFRIALECFSVSFRAVELTGVGESSLFCAFSCRQLSVYCL